MKSSKFISSVDSLMALSANSIHIAKNIASHSTKQMQMVNNVLSFYIAPITFHKLLGDILATELHFHEFVPVIDHL